MIRHLLLFLDRCFLAQLEPAALIHAESVDPVYWLVSKKAEISLPADQVVGMLHNEGTLLWRVVVFAVKKVVS